MAYPNAYWTGPRKYNGLNWYYRKPNGKVIGSIWQSSKGRFFAYHYRNKFSNVFNPGYFEDAKRWVEENCTPRPKPTLQQLVALRDKHTRLAAEYDAKITRIYCLNTH